MASARQKKPKTVLQALFIKRVEQELERQGISRNALAGRTGAPSQSTLNEILNGSDPRLEQVHKIAVALGVQAYELLAERPVGESLQTGNNIRHLPSYPPMIGQGAKPMVNKAHDKRKRRA